MNDFNFEIDKEVKEEFLKSYIPTTRKNVETILVPAEKYERKRNKKLYELSYEEIDDLMFTRYNNPRLSSVESVISILSKYVDTCKEKKLVGNNENRFSVLSTKNLRKYVNKNAIENSYFPWSKIKEIQKYIYNDIDKLILELVYYSIRGRTEKGNTCEELRNLKRNPRNSTEGSKIYIDKDSNTIDVFRNDFSETKIYRTIHVKPETITLIEDVIDCNEYVTNNGEERIRKFGNPKQEVIKLEDIGYVFRPINTKNLKGQVHELFFIQQLKKIEKWSGFKYLTLNNLYYSGMIEKAVTIFNNTGKEPTYSEYSTIVDEAAWGETDVLRVANTHKLKKLCHPYYENRGE